MRILVLGASGYLGGRIAAELAGSGHEILAHRGRADGDLREAAAIERLAALEPDVAIHTVALNHKRSEESIADALAVNVGTVWPVARELRKGGLRRWIYFSTQQVYGRIQSGERIDEDRPPAPVTAYGLTHLQAELAGEMLQRTTGLQCVSLRLSNGCGAPASASADCWWLVVNDLCRMAVEQGVLKLLSDGTAQRDFIHLSDVVSAVRTVIEAPAIEPRYNLGSGETRTILELAKEVAAIFQRRTGRAIPIILPEGAKPVETPRFQYDIRRLRALGFAPKHSVGDAIDEVFDFLAHQP